MLLEPFDFVVLSRCVGMPCKILFIVAASMSLGDEKKEAAAEVTVEIMSSRDGGIQKAIFWRPESARVDGEAEPVPLLVFLHSWSGDYLQGATRLEHAQKRGWIFIAPNFRGPNRRTDACASELASQDILDAVDYANRHAKVDADRVYLVGGSGGGHMSLVMAARTPEVWAGVSSWCPITDLAAWHSESTIRKNAYAKMIEQCCGGPPSPATMAEYHKRSPLFHLKNAKGLPVDISAGIHDGHRGSVPISHTLRAYNVLAQVQGGPLLLDDDIAEMVATQKVPSSLVAEREDDPERASEVLFRRSFGNTRVTIFEGGHEFEFESAILWLARQRRHQPADWTVHRDSTSQNDRPKEISK